MRDKITLNLSEKEGRYLMKLLNSVAEDFSKKYPDEALRIQEEIYLFPRKERVGCPICNKTMIQTIFKGKAKYDVYPYSCSKKCQKELDSWK
jgi:endogenous inhibitor of DNA gyrase (YacG/DUF329 family)